MQQKDREPPEKHERGVDGHDDGAQGEAGGGIGQDRGPKTRLCIEKGLAEVKKDQAASQGEEDRPRADEKRMIPTKPGKKSDYPRHQRRFAIITQGEMTGPIPVIGLVRGEVKRGKPDIEKVKDEKPQGQGPKQPPAPFFRPA